MIEVVLTLFYVARLQRIRHTVCTKVVKGSSIRDYCSYALAADDAARAFRAARLSLILAYALFAGMGFCGLEKEGKIWLHWVLIPEIRGIWWNGTNLFHHVKSS